MVSPASGAAPVVALHLVSGAGRCFSTWNHSSSSETGRPLNEAKGDRPSGGTGPAYRPLSTRSGHQVAAPGSRGRRVSLGASVARVERPWHVHSRVCLPATAMAQSSHWRRTCAPRTRVARCPAGTAILSRSGLSCATPDCGEDVRPCCRGRVRGPLHVEDAGHGKTETSKGSGHRADVLLHSAAHERQPCASHRAHGGHRRRGRPGCSRVVGVLEPSAPRTVIGTLAPRPAEAACSPDRSAVEVDAGRTRPSSVAGPKGAPASVPPNRESSWDNLKS